MNKTLLFIAALIALPFMTIAQSVEVTPFGGYVFGSTLNGDYGEVYYNDNAQYGGMISLAVSRVMDLDLIYNRSDTKAEVNYYNYGGYVKPSLDIPLSINYIQIGVTKNFRVNPTVSPFIGFNMGACGMVPKEDYSDAWFFSVGMNAGAKIYFAKRIGLRLQMQGYIPVQSAGFSMFVGTGGSSAGVSVYSTMFQFGFTGGLIFRLGKIE
jgi:hypothetical protein